MFSPICSSPKLIILSRIFPILGAVLHLVRGLDGSSKTFLDSDNIGHNTPQHVFITYHDRDFVDDIVILKTETLTSDMHKLGFTDFNIFDNKNINNVNYYKYLNSDSIKMINDFYDLDFILFGYNKLISRDHVVSC